MGRMGQILVAGSTVLLLALSAVTALAAPVASGGLAERSSTLVSTSPVVFAERVTAAHQSTGDRGFGPLQNTIELILLAAVCAVGVAFYAAASAQRAGARVPARIRQR